MIQQITESIIFMFFLHSESQTSQDISGSQNEESIHKFSAQNSFKSGKSILTSSLPMFHSFWRKTNTTVRRSMSKGFVSTKFHPNPSSPAIISIISRVQRVQNRFWRIQNRSWRLQNRSWRLQNRSWRVQNRSPGGPGRLLEGFQRAPGTLEGSQSAPRGSHRISLANFGAILE